jgi:prenylcysteine oxidase/farnesylcysteine lyase
MPFPRPTLRVQVLIAVLFLTLSTYLIASYPTTPSFPTFPPDSRFTYPTDAHHGAVAQVGSKRVAIIGAGASGSSAAWFLSRAGRVMKDRMGKEVLGDITVFERDDRIGGRKYSFS